MYTVTNAAATVNNKCVQKWPKNGLSLFSYNFTTWTELLGTGSKISYLILMPVSGILSVWYSWHSGSLLSNSASSDEPDVDAARFNDL